MIILKRLSKFEILLKNTLINLSNLSQDFVSFSALMCVYNFTQVINFGVKILRELLQCN